MPAARAATRSNLLARLLRLPIAVTFNRPYRRATAFVRLPARIVLSALLLLACVARAQAATRPVTVATPDATRAELTALLDSLQRVGERGSTRERNDRQSEIASIRARLAQGDLRAGDRFLIDLNAGGQSGLASGQTGDTVVVREGQEFALRNWPTTSLRGVLRSELEFAVLRYIGVYIREPRVHVYPLTRIMVSGGVSRPGFYAIDPQRPLSDAIMIAGGPASTAQYDKISIYRGGQRLMREKEVTRVLREGRTIDDLELQSGDQIRVATKATRNWTPIIQGTLIGVTALTALLALVRSTYSD